MHKIIITQGHQCQFATAKEFRLHEHWQSETPANYLKLFMLSNFPLQVKHAGLPDEEYKTLQYYGQTVWEEGQTKASFWGKTFEIVSYDL